MVYNNGKLITLGEAQLSIFNRGLAYGDAVFETIKTLNGKILFWEDHYFRLMASMRILRMEIPMTFTPELLEQQILDLINVQTNNSNSYRVKFTVYRESIGFYTPDSNAIGYFITALPLDNDIYLLNTSSYRVELFKDHYVVPGLLSTLKTNNKAINVLASIFAKENDFENCLLINTNKSVVEALNGNLFLVKDQIIKTPPLVDGALKGILRQQLISIIEQSNTYKLEETSISPFELQKADEMFVTNVIQGIQPITDYRKKSYTTKVSQLLLAQLNVKLRLS
jgi:branched-chain amino acid aminotransferase